MAPCLAPQPACLGTQSGTCNRAASGSRTQLVSPSSLSTQRLACAHGSVLVPRVCRRHTLVARAAVAEATRLDVTQMAPLGDRVLVKQDEEKAVTAGGILLTTGATKAIQEALIGEVLAAGEDVDIGVKKGDKVVYSKYGSTDVPLGDGTISFVAQKSIMAVLS